MQTPKDKPQKNLLITISDEHRKDVMGCVKHPIVKTPNLDALAARGAVYENAYTPSPLCVPTRASLVCGDHVYKIGHWKHWKFACYVGNGSQLFDLTAGPNDG